jgi:hypothetical protein
MPDEIKIDLFHPQQPRIPGVSHAEPDAIDTPVETPEPVLPSATLERVQALVPLLWFLLTIAGIATAGAGLFLWSKKTVNKAVPDAQPVTSAAVAAPLKAKNTTSLPVGPGFIATTEEIAKPWSSKEFLFRNPVTNAAAPAVLVRLPGGALWALSLRQPFGDCDLEYVTSPEKLQADYRVHSSHPMIADPCNGTVFDLSRYGNGPNGLVRGEIVAGTAVRPPIAIEVQTRGKQIFATRSE